jgi:hypothetical protein
MCNIYGAKEVWLGFERSADEGNGVYWQGHEVNHQYDKSSIFLHSVREYLTEKHPQLSSVILRSTLQNLWEIDVRIEILVMYYRI